MSLERAFMRLTLQPKTVCSHCRRSFASGKPRAQQQATTSAVEELLKATRGDNGAQRNLSSQPPPSSTAATGPPIAATSSSNAAFDLARKTVQETTGTRRKSQLAEREARLSSRKDYEQQMPRRWKAGDIYSPHDLSGVEASKWKKIRRKPRVRGQGRDVLDQLGIDPREHYKNFSMMAEYVSEMGRIKHSSESGLRPVNQRRMAKAIRRAIGMGLMPSVYKHPELLREEVAYRSNWQKNNFFS
ncbi:hypothetical protein BAUCODRAFT_148523 [Baudoinia panamericana UAMH 10762]|uniref:Small ribosomal subunit protein bS18m n=1 Tax=Baudoinia panamericana (strain UAMH 10762) TaxID=717646 RepID=M2LMS5_BAUPA|nr:uncharacterized protein BAUCODRAFT_148523 [Baudoinia panamericana UAMH 10762]EMC95632.1 hypothetical protein BAUCODRAFT_148523 [Baudoinia panamericana UAMH 10762]